MTIPDSVRMFAARAPSIDSVREEAARCCEETAKMERGERPPLRMDGLFAEFSDAAAGTAAEVACMIGDTLQAKKIPFEPAFCWQTAATLLRNGWQRGDRLLSHIIDEDNAS